MFGLIAAITTKVAVEMFATGAGAAISLLRRGCPKGSKQGHSRSNNQNKIL